jgi:hypothetical protein
VSPAATPLAGGAAGAETARIILVGKPGCHLCDDARAVIARVAGDLGESWTEVSILDRDDLRERYAEQIPVTLVDGRQIDYWHVDEGRLRAALAARRTES